MAVIKPVHEKKPYLVHFTAGPGNPGDLYVVLTGWVPTGKGAMLPPPTKNELSAGESCDIEGDRKSTRLNSSH